MTQPAGALSRFATLRQDADRSAHGPRELGGVADVQLVALAREDSAAAIEAMYSAYKGRIYTFLLRFLADAEMADDVTQDTFTKAYAALGSLTAGHRVLPWLYRIATNTALDHVRRRRRFRWIQMTSVTDTAEEPQMQDEHGRVPEREHIQAVLRALPPVNAIALLLHAVEGYSYTEIAEIQGVSMTAVRSRIARARASFRRGYGETAEGGAGGDQPA